MNVRHPRIGFHGRKSTKSGKGCEINEFYYFKAQRQQQDSSTNDSFLQERRTGGYADKLALGSTILSEMFAALVPLRLPGLGGGGGGACFY